MRFRPAIALLLVGLAAADARAEVALSATTEHFAWSEDTSPFQVKESGPRFALGLALAQPQAAAGVRFAYRGKLYAGRVGYDGAYLFAPTVPVSGKTEYKGSTHRGEIRVTMPRRFEAVGALDLELWRRRLSADQNEDYRVVSFRLGAERLPGERDRWRLGAGFRLPISAREDAHFDDLGFDQNPILEPGLIASPYAELGYRVAEHWMLAGYWDGLRLSRSDSESLTRRGVRQGSFYQPASDLRIIGLVLARDF